MGMDSKRIDQFLDTVDSSLKCNADMQYEWQKHREAVIPQSRSDAQINFWQFV